MKNCRLAGISNLYFTKCFLLLFMLTTLFLISACDNIVPPIIDDGNEPPTNMYLADSPWPMSHRNPYAQASSPYAGPSVKKGLTKDYDIGLPGIITIAVSGPYSNGSRVLWGSSTGYVFKAHDTGSGFRCIDMMIKENITLPSLISTDDALSGAYTLVDSQGIFFVPRYNKIYAYGDSRNDDPMSDIEVKGVYEVPSERYVEGDRIVGLNITHDGMLAFVTAKGLLAVLARDFSRAEYFSFGPDDEISNSIACDEDGGIYVVTSRKIYRVQWTGSELTTEAAQGGWAADYETGDDSSGIRLGAGSGSTPTLMGTGSQDKFVVITDGSELMNLVLFWRDAIPGDWQQIPGTKDRRIAAQVPITFGEPGAEKSVSEQSVCIRGYGALVVNNLMKESTDRRIINLLMGGLYWLAPYGAEKFQWDPDSRMLTTAWVNRDVSYPNGIPTMSAASNMVYDVGQRMGVWGFEALDWETGESLCFKSMGILPLYNSAYAATEIGLDGALYSGTILGLMGLWP